MRHKSTSFIPEPIVQLQRELEQFRGSHAHRTRLPVSPWQPAMELAREHGLHAVAHPIKLDYAQLRKLLGGVEPVSRKSASPAFVELIASHSVPMLECVIEFESSLGGRMRIQ